MSLPVGTTPDADTQIREIDNWWRTTRRSSRDLFVHELTASFDIIGDAPYIGRGRFRCGTHGVVPAHRFVRYRFSRWRPKRGRRHLPRRAVPLRRVA